MDSLFNHFHNVYIRYSHAKASAARALQFFFLQNNFFHLPTCSGYRKSQKNLN